MLMQSLVSMIDGWDHGLVFVEKPANACHIDDFSLRLVGCVLRSGFVQVLFVELPLYSRCEAV